MIFEAFVFLLCGFSIFLALLSGSSYGQDAHSIYNLRKTLILGFLNERLNERTKTRDNYSGPPPPESASACMKHWGLKGVGVYGLLLPMRVVHPRMFQPSPFLVRRPTPPKRSRTMIQKAVVQTMSFISSAVTMRPVLPSP